MVRKDLWAYEDKKAVRDMWMKGYSALYIGNKMGKTRRSIIGAVSRMGLTRVDRPPNPAQHKPTRRYAGRMSVRKPLAAILGHKRSDGKPVTVKNEPMPAPTVAAKTGYRQDGRLLGLMELRFNSCRWPVGDPQREGFGYCGAQADVPCPYCVIHKKIAYYPSGARRI